MKYELYYWPSIQGRGEFIRLALEDAGADYVDVARRKNGMKAMTVQLKRNPVFAPPFLRAGELVIAQTAEILFFLGPRLRLAPKSEAARLHLHQQQLTITDYEEQKEEALRRSKDWRHNRLPKFMAYFERTLDDRFSYLHLSLFQMIEGLRYAFPRTMSRIETKYPKLISLHGKVKGRKGIAAYLASPRRIPFNQQGIFRHYPELDA